MTYEIEIKPSCHDNIKKLCKRNPLLEDILKKKIEEIIEDPYHYKPLKYELAGERRVHIMKSLVLKFEIDEERKTVIFLFFGHHDESYKR
ncbi:MAG: type II toxin-antitoxin system RelE/ParE family toxin [Nanoarchaeota archaeon]|nr:type II toxin-antitoxin system RelE/ParE family toxin [Nanoarchaeota archaeon]